MSNFPFWIKQGSSRSGVHLLHVFVLLIRGDVSLGAWSRRNYRKPDDAFVGPLLLQTLHVATLVMLLRERTSVIVPFQDNKFAFVIGEFVRLAVTVGAGKVGRLVTNLDCQCGNGEQSQNDED